MIIMIILVMLMMTTIMIHMILTIRMTLLLIARVRARWWLHHDDDARDHEPGWWLRAGLNWQGAAAWGAERVRGPGSQGRRDVEM